MATHGPRPQCAGPDAANSEEPAILVQTHTWQLDDPRGPGTRAPFQPSLHVAPRLRCHPAQAEQLGIFRGKAWLDGQGRTHNFGDLAVLRLSFEALLLRENRRHRAGCQRLQQVCLVLDDCA